MTSAVASGTAFGSWREARDKLLEFIDDSTVLVGHSLNYDENTKMVIRNDMDNIAGRYITTIRSIISCIAYSIA